MKPPSPLSLLIFAVAVMGFGLSLPVSAQEEQDWLEYYFTAPTPERLVAEMKNWAADGTLENEGARPALIGFISQVVRQNRGEVAAWDAALAGLTPSQLQLWFTALLFSRTEEADKLMLERFGDRYREQKVETGKILELPLDKEMTVDMLWGYFYATGSAEAIRRIVLCFRFADAPDTPEGFKVPEGYVPQYKMLPHFAAGSLTANGSRHPEVLAELERLLKEGTDLLESEKNGVYGVLSELLPEKYPHGERAEKAA